MSTGYPSKDTYESTFEQQQEIRLNKLMPSMERYRSQPDLPSYSGDLLQPDWPPPSADWPPSSEDWPPSSEDWLPYGKRAPYSKYWTPYGEWQPYNVKQAKEDASFDDQRKKLVKMLLSHSLTTHQRIMLLNNLQALYLTPAGVRFSKKFSTPFDKIYGASPAQIAARWEKWSEGGARQPVKQTVRRESFMSQAEESQQDIKRHLMPDYWAYMGGKLTVSGLGGDHNAHESVNASAPADLRKMLVGLKSMTPSQINQEWGNAGYIEKLGLLAQLGQEPTENEMAHPFFSKDWSIDKYMAESQAYRPTIRMYGYQCATKGLSTVCKPIGM
jgi:hypothetical protein